MVWPAYSLARWQSAEDLQRTHVQVDLERVRHGCVCQTSRHTSLQLPQQFIFAFLQPLASHYLYRGSPCRPIFLTSSTSCRDLDHGLVLHELVPLLAVARVSFKVEIVHSEGQRQNTHVCRKPVPLDVSLRSGRGGLLAQRTLNAPWPRPGGLTMCLLALRTHPVLPAPLRHSSNHESSIYLIVY